jgi:hypothetical protein
MKRIALNNRLQKYLSIVIVAIIAITATGCPCKDCDEEERTTDQRAQKRQEALAKQEHQNDGKPGMIFAFNKEEGKSVRQTAGLETSTVYKDLSLHYNFQDTKKKCPLGLQSNHTSFTAGPNINFKSAGDDVYAEGSHKPGIGFQAGLKTTYRFSDKFSVVSGLLYKQNNAKETGTISDGGEPPYYYTADIEDKYSYSYLSAPVVAQINLTNDLSLSAGPEINYLLNAKVDSKVTSQGETHSSKESLTKNSVKLGVGVQAGIKYEIPDSRWALELVYDHRLSRLNKKNPEGYGNYEVPAWRMKSVQLGVSCRICDLVKGPKHQQAKRSN